MTETVIHAESLSKKYRRGAAYHPGLRHALDGFTAAPDGQQQEKLAEVTTLVGDASAAVKGVSDGLAALNKKMNDAGIPHIVPAPPRPRTGPADGTESEQ